MSRPHPGQPPRTPALPEPWIREEGGQFVRDDTPDVQRVSLSGRNIALILNGIALFLGAGLLILLIGKMSDPDHVKLAIAGAVLQLGLLFLMANRLTLDRALSGEPWVGPSAELQVRGPWLHATLRHHDWVENESGRAIRQLAETKRWPKNKVSLRLVESIGLGIARLELVPPHGHPCVLDHGLSLEKGRALLALLTTEWELEVSDGLHVFPPAGWRRDLLYSRVVRDTVAPDATDVAIHDERQRFVRNWGAPLAITLRPGKLAVQPLGPPEGEMQWFSAPRDVLGMGGSEGRGFRVATAWHRRGNTWEAVRLMEGESEPVARAFVRELAKRTEMKVHTLKGDSK